ncbi:hypothetical protein VNX24_24175 [Citrobacter farmeri]|nr:hypothetical protein [Citrobacter farmeri]MEC3934267.1 hypothetical protein [Citrobacter farmeri]
MYNTSVQQATPSPEPDLLSIERHVVALADSLPPAPAESLFPA